MNKLFLLGFTEFWNNVRIFFHEMNMIVKALIVSFFFILALFALIKLIKQKKFKVWPIILFAITFGLGCFVIFI